MHITSYTYHITLLTGLHIGGSKDGLQIGGIDNTVIKHPHTNFPYIPGSSLKGRMRGLLELKYGLRDIACCERKNEKISYHNITDNPQEVIARSFGCASNDIKITSRLLFSDFHLIQTDIIKKYISSTGKLSNDFYEDKAEVTIPRNMFDKPNPRHQERVPAGVSFEGNITLVEPNTLDFAISQKTLEEILEEGIALIQNTYLGGGGTRGNGRVMIQKI